METQIEEAPEQPDLKSVMSEIISYQLPLAFKIDNLQTDIGLHSQNLDNIQDHIATAETMIDMKKDITVSQTVAICTLVTKAEYIENHNHKNNLMIIGHLIIIGKHWL